MPYVQDCQRQKNRPSDAETILTRSAIGLRPEGASGPTPYAKGNPFAPFVLVFYAQKSIGTGRKIVNEEGSRS